MGWEKGVGKGGNYGMFMGGRNEVGGVRRVNFLIYGGV